jgi:hypothetical protein
MAAVAREKKGSVTRADMADVEHYAGRFPGDLVKGRPTPRPPRVLPTGWRH